MRSERGTGAPDLGGPASAVRGARRPSERGKTVQGAPMRDERVGASMGATRDGPTARVAAPSAGTARRPSTEAPAAGAAAGVAGAVSAAPLPRAAPTRKRPRADRQPRELTREQQLAQLAARLKNAARRKRKDTAWRRSPAFALLQERKALEAERRAQLEQVAHDAEQLPLHKPPPWWAALWAESPRRKQQTSLRVELGGDLALSRPEWELDPASVFSLRLEPRSLDEVDLLWSFPPANPGSSNAWVGLFPAQDGVHDPRGRVRFRLFTRDAQCGVSTYGAKFWRGLPDGEYLFALMADYGVESRALSQRFWLLDARVVMLDAEPGGVALASALDSSSRAAKRFALSSHALIDAEHEREDEPQDERCYFPVPLVDVVLGREAEPAAAAAAGGGAAGNGVAGGESTGGGAAGGDAAGGGAPGGGAAAAGGFGGVSSVISHRIKRVYQLTDKESYLDWGLSSDYEAVGDERRAKPSASAPDVYVAADVVRVMRAGKQTGLGGNTHGSEGYGEATIGSVHKLVLLMQNLRALILANLYKDAQWNPLYDLTPLSTFVDIGSGYGKVVVHAKLEAKVRRCVGIECVHSRHVIADKVLSMLRADLHDETHRAAAGRHVGDDGGGAATSQTGSQPAGAPELSGGAGASGSDATTSPTTAASTAAAPDLAALWGLPACVDLTALSTPYVKDTDLYRGIELRHDDATLDESLPFTHIYVFDRVFSKRTLIALAQVLTRSPFFVFVSFRPCNEWWRYGLVKVQPVAKLNCRTTGKEGCNAYVYINLERAPGFTHLKA
ncbi:hypothetical protein KFE25_006402 [Diacronema lutheri]|uniref:DOT1 domain-containing protein n=2 Tax=Diacronema lutheri TaxID=2081491 RepID=A0A8J5XWI4_DIALT|nr:hypothetical protein KFE25_006402 [Diacronema lutheri]